MRWVEKEEDERWMVAGERMKVEDEKVQVPGKGSDSLYSRRLGLGHSIHGCRKWAHIRVWATKFEVWIMQSFRGFLPEVMATWITKFGVTNQKIWPFYYLPNSEILQLLSIFWSSNNNCGFGLFCIVKAWNGAETLDTWISSLLEAFYPVLYLNLQIYSNKMPTSNSRGFVSILTFKSSFSTISKTF